MFLLAFSILLEVIEEYEDAVSFAHIYFINVITNMISYLKLNSFSKNP